MPMQQLLRTDTNLPHSDRYLLVCATGRRSLAAAGRCMPAASRM